jgi:hypothetical protein
VRSASLLRGRLLSLGARASGCYMNMNLMFLVVFAVIFAPFYVMYFPYFLLKPHAIAACSTLMAYITTMMSSIERLRESAWSKCVSFRAFTVAGGALGLTRWFLDRVLNIWESATAFMVSLINFLMNGPSNTMACISRIKVRAPTPAGVSPSGRRWAMLEVSA